MRASYKRLWKILIDKDLNKSDLRKMASLSTVTLAKLGKDESVTTEVLIRICTALNCNISDIMEVVRDDETK